MGEDNDISRQSTLGSMVFALLLTFGIFTAKKLSHEAELQEEKENSSTRETTIKQIEEATSAVNEASKHVAGFTAFLLVTTYLVISAGGTTHLMLLLETSLPVPLINVSLPLKAFYTLVPFVYVLLHLNLVLHVRMLDAQIDVFETSLAELRTEKDETDDDLVQMRERRRKLLFPFFFNRALLASEERSGLTVLFRVLFWITVFIVPIGALLFVQLQFLPYHSLVITYFHRIFVVLDLAILAFGWGYAPVANVNYSNWFKFFIALVGQALGKGFKPVGDAKVRYLVNPRGRTRCTLGLLTLYITFFAFTIPDEFLDRYFPSLSPTSKWLASHIPWASEWLEEDHLGRNLVVQFQTLSSDLPSVKDRLSLWVTDESREQWLKELPQLSFIGRDFRYADFTGSRFFTVYFKECKLDQALFFNATLEHATILYSTLDGTSFEACTAPRLLLGYDTGNQTNFKDSVFPGFVLINSQFVNSNWSVSDLFGGYIADTEFRNADFSDANLEGAELWQCELSATFDSSSLEATKWRNCTLRSCDFSNAFLQGSNFSSFGFPTCKFEKADIQHSTIEYPGGIIQQAFQGILLFDQKKLINIDFDADPYVVPHPMGLDAAYAEETYVSPNLGRLMMWKHQVKPEAVDKGRREVLLNMATKSPWVAVGVWNRLNYETKSLRALLDKDFRDAYTQGTITFPPGRTPNEFKKLKVKNTSN